MTDDDQNFVAGSLKPAIRTIKVGGGLLYSKMMGTALMRASGRTMKLKDCLLVPRLGANLLSVRKLCSTSKLEGAFNATKMYLRDKNGPLVSATFKNGVYVVDHIAEVDQEVAFDAQETISSDVEAMDVTTPIEKVQSQGASAYDPNIDHDDGKPVYSRAQRITQERRKRYTLFHRRFGHVGPNQLRKLHTGTDLERPITIPDSIEICEICMKTKLRNRRSKVLAKHKDCKLDLLSIDIAGPFPKSIRGYRFFVEVLDNYTRKVWILLLKKKDDVIPALNQLAKTIELESGEVIKGARSDNAGEIKKVVEEWKASRGTSSQSTAIYSSYQNGPAERGIQISENGVRALLKDAKLPVEFWCYAVMADAYLRNRLIHGPFVERNVDGELLSQQISPEEAWTGKVPGQKHIHPFGCLAYSYVDPDSQPEGARTDKYVDRGRECVFVGYSDNTTKQWLVYAPDRHDVISSNRVVFNEDVPGGTIDLKLRMELSGGNFEEVSGTSTDLPERKPRGRPKKVQFSPYPASRPVMSRGGGVGNTVIGEQEDGQRPVDMAAEQNRGERHQENESAPVGCIAYKSPSVENVAEFDGDTIVVDTSHTPFHPTSHPITPKRTSDIDWKPKSTMASLRKTDSGRIEKPEAVRRSPRIQQQLEDVVDRLGISELERLRSVADIVDAVSIEEAHDGSNKTTSAAQVLIPEVNVSTEGSGLPAKRGIEDVDDAELPEAKSIRAMIALMEVVDDEQFQMEHAMFSSVLISAAVNHDIPIPKSYHAAINDPVWGEMWKSAIDEEIKSLLANGTWEQCKLPKGAIPVDSKWVLTVKKNPDGTVERFKARLVGRGFTQIYGENYTETFAPTVQMATLRALLSVAAAENLEIRHYDIKNAFTEAVMKEEVYMKPPQGVPVKSGFVLKVLRSLYGLKQSARDWNKLLTGDEGLRKWGFVQSLADPCLFTHPARGLIALVYVDDIAVASPSNSDLDWFFKQLKSRFDGKDLGEIKQFLGMRVTRDRKERTIWLDQEQYLDKALNQFGITKGKATPSAVPVSNYDDLRAATLEDERVDATEYAKRIGTFMFAMVYTRPDIAFAIGRLSQFMKDPAVHHWRALKTLMRYLRSTYSLRLRFGPGGNSTLVVYSDADYAMDKTDRKSISGALGMLWGAAIFWFSRKQRSVSTSTTEAEYIALSLTAKQGQWVAQVLRDMGYPQYVAENGMTVETRGDNQGSLALIKNPILHEHSKHIDVARHHVRDLYENKKIAPSYVNTKSMLADGMTKPLPKFSFETYRHAVGLRKFDGE